MTRDQIQEIINAGESLRVEFKGEEGGPLSDREIYEVIVCLANSQGGVLVIGVENEGRITGARARHGATTDAHRLQAAIFNNTVPSVNTRISVDAIGGRSVIALEVDPYPEICATRDGRSLRRVIGVDGPACIPFYPYEHQSRRSDLGLFDYSAQIVEGASWVDFDPLEFERLRQTIERLHGDNELLSLDDRQIAQALRFVETRNGELAPNVSGLLLLGREEPLRRFIPAHGVAFQVLDEQGGVRVNDFLYHPLLKSLEIVEQRFRSLNREQEVPVGLFRLPVPDYVLEAFREAVNNALLHRDYTRLGTSHIQFHPDHLFVTSPGGFLDGITLDNLLVHEPKPRNPRLAEAFRRIGLVETTGRGIDKIYLGQLRYGRPLPDYTQTDREAVRLVLYGGAASLEFAAFVYEQNRAGAPLSLDELLVLNQLQHERRIDAPMVGHLTQRGEAHARAVLERLVERGLIEGRGERGGRVYHLSAALYRQLGAPSGYVRAHGFDSIRQEAMVMEYVTAHGRITRGEVMELCMLTGRQATKLLHRLVEKEKLIIKGSPPRWVYYELAPRE
jgi:ATP-dependent DNA helicase RecG